VAGDKVPGDNRNPNHPTEASSKTEASGGCAGVVMATEKAGDG